MIPFVDLKAQYRSIKPEIDEAVARVLQSGHFALGPEVAAFEEKFAAYCRAKHAIGVNSGTSALHLALLALGVGPGDEVVAPAMTFVATACSIAYTGARPVLVDVEPDFYGMDPSKLEAAITPRTKAIVPVHLYGQPAEMDPILEIADRRGIPVLEDAAQAHGAEYRGRRCGSMGRIAAFSFYPGKNLGAYGEGGLVSTNDDDLAARVRSLRDWGQKAKGRHELKGYNYRMDGMQGAILAVKMNHIEDWTERRRSAAAVYGRLLREAGLTPVRARESVRHVYHIYSILIPNREKVSASLSAAGVQWGIHYPLPIHLQPCFSELGHGAGDFPVAERLGKEELSLPMFPELTEGQIREVVHVLADANS